MLSSPLQRFSPDYSLPSKTFLPTSHIPTSNPYEANLAASGHDSQSAFQHLQQHVDVSTTHSSRVPQPKHRQLHKTPTSRSTSAGDLIRRRISRACDQCNQARTKCDGQDPCAHCIGGSGIFLFGAYQMISLIRAESGRGCEYIRERKKRGKTSRRDLAQKAAAQSAEAEDVWEFSILDDEDGLSTERTTNCGMLKKHQPSNSREKVFDDLSEEAMERGQAVSCLESLAELDSHQPHLATNISSLQIDQLDSPTSLDLDAFGHIQSSYTRQGARRQMITGPAHHSYGPSQSDLSNYPYILSGPQPQGVSNYTTGGNSINAYPITGEPTSAGWVTMSSPPPRYQSYIPQVNYHQQLRYPVLSPLLPHLGNILPVSLACDLIDLYFASSSAARAHPMSPYVLGFVFRKRSFLHPDKPRQCQPALLASILWASAQTSDAPFIASVPSARGELCHRLLELTVSLLKPLIHTSFRDSSPVTKPVMSGVTVGGLGIAVPDFMSLNNVASKCGPFGAAGTLDDVVTYIHLATVFSASENKGASLRWWNAAWSLARELKLGSELPCIPLQQIDPETANNNTFNELNEEPGAVTNEEREERRRIWWLTYTMDRHLALCYNRPLFLLDIECGGLFQPMDETEWQNGHFQPKNTDPTLSHDRVRGPHLECTGHSIFGYFLPLMTILGEIVELHHARNHPRFGISCRSATEWDDQVAKITRHLEIYEESLEKFEQQNFQAHNDNSSESLVTLEMAGELERIGSPSARPVCTNSSRMTESDIQTRIVMSYGTHVMHVLHILLAGKWDPINLLDDNDLWISSQNFITATAHAVSAAEAIRNILQYDPGLEFMPFFYGIYLLQGSFLLLLIADKLQAEASVSVVGACETIIRAHEACVVTLDTGYQVNSHWY